MQAFRVSLEPKRDGNLCCKDYAERRVRKARKKTVTKIATSGAVEREAKKADSNITDIRGGIYKPVSLRVITWNR